MCLVILLLLFILRRFHQPYLIAYIIAGIILGPHVTGIFSSTGNIISLGEIGILLLMFFLGIEINIPDKRNYLRIPLIAQAIKTILCMLVSVLIGKWLHWSVGNIVLLTILFVFNSTAVVSEFLRKNRELQTFTGRIVLNMLLLQDVMIGPVLTFFQFWGNHKPDPFKIFAALTACLLIFLLLRAIRNRGLLQAAFVKEMQYDHELQVFAGAFICLGFALLASAAGLTPAMGSFVAGIYIGRSNVFQWLENVLHPFKIFFVALFFMSIGLSLEMAYITSNYKHIIVLAFLVLVINSLLSAIVFKIIGISWSQSIYVGALLSQTGELGILACSLAHELNIVDDNFFKDALAITGLSLLCSTIWMAILRGFVLHKTRLLSTRKLTI
jgi:CPA2 family monovalent cation:H+ antiporter-2